MEHKALLETWRSIKLAQQSSRRPKFCFKHSFIQISSNSLSPCKEKVLERQGNGDFTVVDLLTGKTLCCLNHRASTQVQFGYLKTNQIFTLGYDLRNRKYCLDFFTLNESLLLQSTDILLDQGESLVGVLPTWSCIVLNAKSGQKSRLLSVSLSGQLSVQQAEVSDCQCLYGDSSTLVHCHRANQAGLQILLIQDFV